jgi:ElaA protein
VSTKKTIEGSLVQHWHDGKVQWRFSAFRALESSVLYEALKLRQQIFIVEQDVPYSDIDGLDYDCQHCTGHVQEILVAYLRVLPNDVFEPGYANFGRVVVRQECRGKGLGTELVKRALQFLDPIRGTRPVKISSQLHLKEFYGLAGFETDGASYIQSRIPHIRMLKR